MCSIEFSAIEFALNNILLFLETNDKHYLEVSQSEIKLAKEFDFNIKTQTEYEKGETVLESHGPGRMAMFLLNNKGEYYCNGGKLTIYEDDPEWFRSENKHTNTYILELKDKETHEKLYSTNPTAEDCPYDFNALFVSQYTVYPNNTADTTAHAYESFDWFYKDSNGKKQVIKRGYHTPFRGIDFKSAFWKNGHEHTTDYIFTINEQGQSFLINTKINDLEKQFKTFIFEPLPENTKYLKQYLDWINKFNKLQYYSWEQFIL